MKKLDLNKAAAEFELISDDNQLFYNIETGDFDSYTDPVYFGSEDEIDDNAEKFDDNAWIAAPNRWDLHEYDIMSGFAGTVKDLRKNDLLSVALEGKGAFRRFKDTLHREDLIEEWYAFKHDAFIEIAREWCEENGIEYISATEKSEQEPSLAPGEECPEGAIVVPLVQKGAEEVSTKYSIFIATYPDKEAAKCAARLLIERRLAACVQLFPVESVYLWEEKTCDEEEIMLLIKSKIKLLDKITATIKENHSYEVPEIVQIPIAAGLPEYLKWIDSCVK